MPLMETATLLNAIDVASVLEELGLEFQRTPTCARLRCPLGTHADANPSFLVYWETKRYECKGCNAHGDVVQLAAHVANKTRHEAALWLAHRFDVRTRIVVNPVQVEQWHEQLLQQAATAFRAVLTSRKALSESILAEFKIGLDGDKITIPIPDRDGHFVNVRRYAPFRAGGKNKYSSLRDAASPLELYPWRSLRSDQVVVTEGEFKALCLVDRGFAAVSGTGGAGGWRDEWSPLFAGKTVFVCFDIDNAGRRGAAALCRRLYQYVKTVHLVSLPLDIKDYPKGDVCDFFASGHTPQEFTDLLAATKPWAPAQVGDLERDDTPHETTLSRATRSEFFSKRVLFSGVVSAKDTAPYLVPNVINVACDRSCDVCAICPVYTHEINGERGTVNITIPNESASLLELIDVPKTRVAATLRSVIGIPEECDSSVCRAVRTINLEEIRIVPQIDIGSSEREHTLARAYYVGHGIETNAPFRFDARVYPDPRTQHATLLVTEAIPGQDNLSTFELDNPAALEIFQPSSWTVEAIEDRLREIYSDLSANVTRIYHRPDLHLFVDLIYHTVLWFDFDGVRVKGWAEGLIIGDSGQGKSETTSRLRAHYQLGEKVETKGATVAGLLGGLVESGKRWFVQWGTIVLNDGRLVILEEVKGMSEETIAKLTDLRSSGVGEIVKIERRKANGRCRLIWISNPRSQRRLDTYNHGVEAIKELIGALEDVRRFDMAIAVATGQVPYSVLNAPHASQPRVEHRYTSELCRDLILFAWSRTPGEVVWDADATQECLDAAAHFGQTYSSAIPLVEPADQRFKLARLSVALAARTFSHEAGAIRVRRAHVQVVVRFLQRIYDDPIMGYKQFSDIAREEQQIRDPEEVRTALFNVRFPRDLIRSLLATRVLNEVDLQNFSGLERDAARDLLSVLVRKNCLLSGKRAYIKTPAFIGFLRALQSAPEPATPGKEY